MNIKAVLAQIGNTHKAIDNQWAGIWGKCDTHGLFIIYEEHKDSKSCPFCKSIEYYNYTQTVGHK